MEILKTAELSRKRGLIPSLMIVLFFPENWQRWPHISGVSSIDSDSHLGSQIHRHTFRESVPSTHTSSVKSIDSHLGSHFHRLSPRESKLPSTHTSGVSSIDWHVGLTIDWHLGLTFHWCLGLTIDWHLGLTIDWHLGLTIDWHPFIYLDSHLGWQFPNRRRMVYFWSWLYYVHPFISRNWASTITECWFKTAICLLSCPSARWSVTFPSSVSIRMRDEMTVTLYS